DALKQRRRWRRAWSGAVAAALFVTAMAGYDAWGFSRALAFERASQPAPAVARRWADLLTWHPSMPLFWPSWAREAHRKQDEWAVQAAAVQVAVGTAGPELHDRLTRLKDQAPELATAIRRVEAEQDRIRHEETWKRVRAGALVPTADPERSLDALAAFLRDDPDSSHPDDALALMSTLQGQVTARRSAADREFADELDLAETVPSTDLRDLIDRARTFLAEHSQSSWRGEVERRLGSYIQRLDDRDIDRAREYSRTSP